MRLRYYNGINHTTGLKPWHIVDKTHPHTSRVRGVPDGVSRAPKKNGHKWYRLDGTVETRPTGKESGLPGFILSRATDWTPYS